MSSADRRERLMAAQRRIATAIADPGTNPNMIPQLTGQLVAIERRLDHLDRRHGADTLPDVVDLGFVDFLSYWTWTRQPHPARRTVTPNEWLVARNAVFESWRAVGFELSPRPSDRDETDEWVEEMRTELQRCLEEAE